MTPDNTICAVSGCVGFVENLELSRRCLQGIRNPTLERRHDDMNQAAGPERPRGKLRASCGGWEQRLSLWSLHLAVARQLLLTRTSRPRSRSHRHGVISGTEDPCGLQPIGLTSWSTPLQDKRALVTRSPISLYGHLTVRHAHRGGGSDRRGSGVSTIQRVTDGDLPLASRAALSGQPWRRHDEPFGMSLECVRHESRVPRPLSRLGVMHQGVALGEPAEPSPPPPPP